MKLHLPAIARSGATKQSSRFDKLKAPSTLRGWIATARFLLRQGFGGQVAHLAMTEE
ncbi:MAG TPA: hypothetical protein VMM36_14070 [Opitutaceae bacterium]|nr:hypothetical protein [Opitutaceae bacterium]